MPDWREDWKSAGLIHIPGALTQESTDRVLRNVDALYRGFLSGSMPNFSVGAETAKIVPGLWRKLLSSPRELQTFKKWNVVELDSELITLIDMERVFSIILEADDIEFESVAAESTAYKRRCRTRQDSNL